ncbi:MAG TPA: DUF523 domain-containing protein [Desulfobacteraceae bacterium]|nr:DUF523 domain-containing protein [Desulfobacteraceae bacterium]
MISACLLGIHCRYDGQSSPCTKLIDLVATFPFVPFCPEQLGGLATPRSPADIRGGDGYDVLSGSARVINTDGKDVTEAFKKGALEALRLAQLTSAEIAIMKDKSPSCGLRTPYCENPSGFGIGITAALLKSHDIRIFESGPNSTFSTIDLLKLTGRS